MVTVFLKVNCLKVLFRLESHCYFLKVSCANCNLIEISRLDFKELDKFVQFAAFFEMGLNFGNINRQEFETISKTLLLLVVVN